MAKPPTGRILLDLRSSGFISDEERQRMDQLFGPSPSERLAEEVAAQWKWMHETPEGRAQLQATQDFIDAEKAMAREEEECRSDRLLKGLPAYVEPKTIHAKIPDPPWKRKLRP